MRSPHMGHRWCVCVVRALARPRPAREPPPGGYGQRRTGDPASAVLQGDAIPRRVLHTISIALSSLSSLSSL